MARRPKSDFRRATDAEKSQAGNALLSAVIDMGEASTDDAHARYELPPSVEQREWGIVTGRMVAECIIRRVGDDHTRRRVAHGRRIGLYRATDLERARQYRDALAKAARRQDPQGLLFSDDEIGGDSNGSI